MNSARVIAQGRRSNKLSKLVARGILEDIVRRRLVTGQHLGSEDELMERYGVGRAAIREALRLLESNGVLTIRSGPGGGPTVKQVDSSDFGRTATLFFFASGTTYGALVEARLVMDPVMARLAAERRTDDDVALLHNLIERAKNLASDDPELLDAGTSFHRAIAGMSKNGVLDIYGQGLMDVYATHFPARLVYPATEREHVRSVHGTIARAVEERDGATAEALMRSHLEEFVAFVRAEYPQFLEETVEWL